MSAPIIWQPTPRQAYFLASSDDEVLFGGAAGGGKSDCLLIDALGSSQRAPLRPRYKSIIIRKTYQQLREIIDRSRVIYQAAVPGSTYHEQAREWRFPSGAKLLFGYLDAPSDKYQYQGEEFQYVGFDELTHHATADGYEYLLSRLRCSWDASFKCYMRSTTNPGGAGHAWVKSRFAIPDDGGATHQVLTLPSGREWVRSFVPSRLADNPHLASTGYADQLSTLPDAERRALLDGRWDTAECADQLIPHILINDARKTPERRDSGLVFVGVDPARMGDDDTAVCVRRGRSVIDMLRWSHLDTMQVAARVLDVIAEYRPAAVNIDVGGLGAGVYDRLAELGHDNVHAINFGSRAGQSERYSNRRAEMWTDMRDWLAAPPVSIPDDDRLAAELACVTYSYDSSQRLKLISKDELRKAGIKSLDGADALALTFATPVVARQLHGITNLPLADSVAGY